MLLRVALPLPVLGGIEFRSRRWCGTRALKSEWRGIETWLNPLKAGQSWVKSWLSVGSASSSVKWGEWSLLPRVSVTQWNKVDEGLGRRKEFGQHEFFLPWRGCRVCVKKKSYLTLVAIFFFFFFFGLGSLVPSSMESISKILGGKGGPKRQGSETSNLPPNNAPPGAAHSCVCVIYWGLMWHFQWKTYTTLKVKTDYS